jgi:cysteinyl-tRNA synthetase
MHGYFLQIEEDRMSKSSGEFLRIQSLIDRGYDPLSYRYFALNANYRSKLTFTWEGLDGAQTSLERLRSAVYDMDEPGTIDEEYVNKFTDQINDDLNMPRALAVTWDLVRSDLTDAKKKATLQMFDSVLGLNLATWQPKEETIPEDISRLIDQRQKARENKNWTEADEIREQLTAAGYHVKDTPDGPQVKHIKQKVGN